MSVSIGQQSASSGGRGEAGKLTLTEELSAHMASVAARDIPNTTIEAAKYAVLDWLGAAIAGVGTPAGRAFSDCARNWGQGSATVIGSQGGASVPVAAFANGGISHVVETDDTDKHAVVHAGVVTVPVALAVAERMGASGRDFLASVIIGYEVALRVGEAIGKRHYHYWHNTATCGTFGSAASASWLLRLEADQWTWALGSAGTQAAGLWQFVHDNAMSKHLHAAKACMNGVISAELAKRNFTGATAILEGSQGLFAAASYGEEKPERVVDGLDEDLPIWKLPRVAKKLYPSCRHTHPAVDAALALRREHSLQPNQIMKIHVASYRATQALTDNPSPDSEYGAKFSVQYCVAAALRWGALRLSDFAPAPLTDLETRRLMSLTSLAVDGDYERRFPDEFASRVYLELADGRKLSRIVDVPKGDIENPITNSELLEKFMEMVTDTPYAALAELLSDRVLTLDECGDVRMLFAGVEW